MGSFIELNDTLQITAEQGFPADILDLKKHRKSPITLEKVKGKIFSFKDKPRARVYHNSIRCFLVQNIGGKWLYWGKCLIIEQTISGETQETQKTSGKFRIIQVYDPKYQEMITLNESPEGLSYFG